MWLNVIVNGVHAFEMFLISLPPLIYDLEALQ